MSKPRDRDTSHADYYDPDGTLRQRVAAMVKHKETKLKHYVAAALKLKLTADGEAALPKEGA